MAEEELPKEKEPEKEKDVSRSLLKTLAASGATYALMATILERDDIMEVLGRDDLSLSEKAGKVAREYLPEKEKEDLLELAIAAITGIIVAGRERAAKEEKKPKEAVEEIVEEIRRLKEETE